MDPRLIFGVISLATTGYLAWRYRHSIRDTVASWLRERGLQQSALMNAWIAFDKLASGIRRRLFVKTKQTGEQKISETTHTWDEIRQSNPDVYAQLQRLSYAEKNILNIVQ